MQGHYTEATCCYCGTVWLVLIDTPAIWFYLRDTLCFVCSFCGREAGFKKYTYIDIAPKDVGKHIEEGIEVSSAGYQFLRFCRQNMYVRLLYRMFKKK